MWVQPYSDYPKSLISRINEAYVSFNKISLFYWKTKQIINFIYNRRFAAITLIIVLACFLTSASDYITSASRYQSTSSMYIRDLIPRKWPTQFRLTLNISSVDGSLKSKKKGKDQELIQSNTTPDTGYHMGKWKLHIQISQTRAMRSALSQQVTTRHQ